MSERIRHIPGYGSSLRQRLEAVGWTQSKLVSESRVSRQTISRAVNRDELTERTRARLDDALGRAPAKRRSARRRDPGFRPPMSSGALCNAADLEAWADRREAQSVLPDVVRRLILASEAGINKLHVRSGEGVHLPAWDGIVEADRGTAFVPKGISGWEMSVAADPKRKAERDWGTRTADGLTLTPADATFVFVTPRRWSDKEEWAARKTKEGPWREVRVLDADDLAAWLGHTPAVHTWLSIRIGKTPRDVRDLKSHWKEWSRATRPALTPQFLLSGRGGNVATLHKRLSEVSGQTIAIQAESKEEAIAWLYCAIQELGPNQAQHLLARCVVVDSVQGFRHLVAASSPLVLVPTFHPEGLAAEEARVDHAVVVALDGTAPRRKDDVIRLDPQCRQSAAEALQAMGIDHTRAHRMAGLARRSLAAFRRSVAVSPGFRQPEWSSPAVVRGVLPALLVGSWKGDNDADRQVVSRLARKPYEEVVDSLLRWSVGSDPLVRRRDDVWYLVSARDAWRLLRRYVMRDDLDRFETVATTVLGSVHPSFELPTEKRWMARVLGYSAEHSGFLSDGLAKTLAIMGARGKDLPYVALSARQVVHELLEKANEDWRLWASLSKVLRLLAEAAPDSFLDAVEAGLQRQKPVLASLFTNAGQPMFGVAYHMGLLRALEVLAWSPDHLGRVVPLLARLDRIDPESELRSDENTRGTAMFGPLTVLRAIFRRRLPQTSATLDARLAALDRLGASDHKVAWHVMQSMLGNESGVRPASRPSVREWAVDADKGVDRDEVIRAVPETVMRMLDAAGSSGSRWTGLLQQLHMLPPREHHLVVDTLKRLDPHELGDEARTAIWEALRSIVARHRAYRSAKWAMPEEYVARLDAIRERFSPADPVALYGWLFTMRPAIVGGDDVRKTPLEVRRQRLFEKRSNAAEAILQRSGLGGLAAFAEGVEDPRALGFAASGVSSGVLQTHEVLSRYLGNPSPAKRELASGYVEGRVGRSDEVWAAQQLQRDDMQLTPDQRVEFLLALPDESNTWRLAAAQGGDVSSAYWRRIVPRYFADDDLAEAVDCLVEAKRPFVAADLIAFDARVTKGIVPPNLVAKLLEAAGTASGEHDAPGPDFGSSAGFLLDALGWANHDRIHLARLEWRLMPVLSYHERPPGNLHRLLAEDPAFLAEVVSLAFRAETEEASDVSVEDERRAECAFSVLGSWRKIPGSKADSRVDGPHLRQWLDGARAELARAERVKIGHQMIGQMLSASPRDRDGTWPCAPIREVIEDLASTDLERGFQMGVHNSRGVVMKDPSAGGAAERTLAERYDGFAVAVRASHPRTAGMLRGIADSYRHEASVEDFQSEMVEDR